MKRIENYKRYIFVSILLNVLGVTSVTAFKDKFGSTGYVIIAVGILFFFLGMNMRKKKMRKKVRSQKKKIKKRR